MSARATTTATRRRAACVAARDDLGLRGGIARNALARVGQWRLAVLVLVASSLLALAGCATTTARRGLPPLATVPHVDLARYAGTWFEIASFPQRFQEGCVASRAEYTPRADGTVAVVNRCRDRTFDGPERSVAGTARVVDAATNAKLAVIFFWPFRGAYWIVDLDPDYRFAAVGHPSRDYLWILSRTPTLDGATYDGIVARLQRQGYDTSRLRRTPQPGT